MTRSIGDNDAKKFGIIWDPSNFLIILILLLLLLLLLLILILLLLLIINSF